MNRLSSSLARNRSQVQDSFTTQRTFIIKLICSSQLSKQPSNIQVKELLIFDFPFEQQFNPLSLYLENSKLYVLNQGQSLTIEIFSTALQPIHLKHQSTYLLPTEYTGKIHSFIALNETTFILTEHQPFGFQESTVKVSFWQRMLTQAIYFFRYESTLLIRCNEEGCEPLYHTHGIMNTGIEWDRENRVFVADSVGQHITVYALDSDFAPIQVIPLDGGPQRLRYNPWSRQLYAAVLPKLLEQLKTYSFYVRSASLPQDLKQYMSVVEIDPQSYAVSDLITTNMAVRGLSCAIKVNDLLVLGSWIDNSLAVCDSSI